MGRVHFVGGEKGGVGKSLTARVLAQYFIDHEHPFAGFDLDHSHATFSRFYADFTAPVKVDDFASLDGILEFAEAHPDHDLVIDLAAQTASYLNAWIDDSDVFGIFAELGYTAYFWHVMDDGVDSLQLLGKTLDSYQHPELNFVVVLNLGRGDDFTYFRESDSFQELGRRSARVFQLRKLETRLSQKIDINSSSFWAAANNRDIMSLVERKRVSTWLEANYKQIDRLLQQSARSNAV